MNEKKLSISIVNATKWASITEIIAKLIIPITNIFLARILTPEAFGVITVVTMIVSFADMFTDAGFQKYIIQHQFKDEQEKVQCINVAFWSNLFISIVLWIIIIIFRNNLAKMLGNPGLGNVIAVSSIQLLLTSFSSIQMSIYRREFDFKTLFLVRVIGICMPFVITIPLALLGWSYWALIIGNICGLLISAIILTIRSSWKPSLFYSIKLLKRMLSFSVWSLAEAISIWLSSWIDTFIIGNTLNTYYIGLYKTSLNTVNGIISILTGSTTPVLFAALSRLQDNDDEFKKVYFNMQKAVAYLIFPMGIGIYLYRDLITYILLGQQWMQASPLIGIWSLINSVKVVFGNYCSELYRAKGQPKISFITQIVFLVLFIPICIISSKYGFWVLVYTVTFGRLIIVVIHNIIMRFIFNLNFSDTLKNVFLPLICAILMGILGLILQQAVTGIIQKIFSIVICVIFYFSIVIVVGKKDVHTFLKFINRT